ncbi:hypothetical protein [Halalkaliarchaeum desulfuricum]|nr:hypothetical protein [Halalkaliarchaeum desulfuricum]
MSSTSIIGRLVNAFKSEGSDGNDGCSCGMKIEEIESEPTETDGK